MNDTLANIFINQASQSKQIIEIESGVEKTHYEVANRAKEISKSDDINNGYSNFIVLGDWNDDLKDVVTGDEHCFTPFLYSAKDFNIFK